MISKENQAWTDYPFEELGDEPYKDAPIRKVEVLNWAKDVYCLVKVEEFKITMYLYRKPFRMKTSEGYPRFKVMQMTNNEPVWE